jgi:hypothetical protein
VRPPIKSSTYKTGGRSIFPPFETGKDILVNGSQLVIPLLSDPFGFGWDLFRTAAYKPDIGFVGPLLQWYVAVGAIVVGHVIAVYLAHVKALTVFGAPRVAVRSQIPIVVFMVGYTMLSLWILSQPIVETSPAA